MIRISTCFSLAALSCLLHAQSPDVVIAVDARPTLLIGDSKNAQLRWFDINGRPSLVGFKVLLPEGNRIAVTQRIAKFPGTGDPDLLDEYYLETPGEWRLGKQVLPFGQKTLFRETALAFKVRTNLVFEDSPIELAVVDAGRGRNKGVVGRIGRTTGISFAMGDHFAIQDSSFSVLRDDLSNVGANRGYRTVFGIDSLHFAYPFTFEGEIVALRQGHTPADGDEEYSDIRCWYQFPGGQNRIGLSWAHQWREQRDSFRIEGEWTIVNQVVLMPHIRFGSAGLGQIGTTIRFRL